MADIPALTLLNFFIYLSIPFTLALILQRFKLPAVIGYIFGGIILANFFSDLTSREIINQFAFFGITLLLFTVGLGVNFERMLALKKFIFVGGVFQILLSMLFIGFFGLILNFTLFQSLLIGMALSISSTSLVARIIQDRGEEGSFLGELTLGILMFQDLAFVPFIIIFNSFTEGSRGFFEILEKIALDVMIASIILFLMYYLGKKVVPFIFDKIARVSRDILNFFIIVFIFFIILLSALLNIPVLIGAFIAGVLVSQTTEHYHVINRIKPFRDLLAAIFFIFIGSNIQFGLIMPQIAGILSFSLLVFFAKAVIILIIFIALRFSSRIAFYCAISLFQISENSFILMSIAHSNRIFTNDQYLFIVTSTILGFVITPILIQKREKIYMGLRAFIRKNIPVVEIFLQHKIDRDRSPIDALDIKNHVVICGYGTVGSKVGKALQLSNIPYIAIDNNFHTVEQAKKEGINIIYGDPTDIDTLDFVETEHATALVSAVSSRFDQEAIIINSKKLNPNLFIISRVQSEEDLQRLKDLGAKTIVQPELEASISIIKRILVLKKISKDEIVKALRHLKLIHGAI